MAGIAAKDFERVLPVRFAVIGEKPEEHQAFSLRGDYFGAMERDHHPFW
jgi:hypothetical protein